MHKANNDLQIRSTYPKGSQKEYCDLNELKKNKKKTIAPEIIANYMGDLFYGYFNFNIFIKNVHM